MPRVNDHIEPDEKKAADAILDLCLEIQDLAYYAGCQSPPEPPRVPPATLRELHRAYRALLPIVKFYHGDDTVLINDPPHWPPLDGKFKKVAK